MSEYHLLFSLSRERGKGERREKVAVCGNGTKTARAASTLAKKHPKSEKEGESRGETKRESGEPNTSQLKSVEKETILLIK